MNAISSAECPMTLHQASALHWTQKVQLAFHTLCTHCHKPSVSPSSLESSMVPRKSNFTDSDHGDNPSKVLISPFPSSSSTSGATMPRCSIRIWAGIKKPTLSLLVPLWFQTQHNMPYLLAQRGSLRTSWVLCWSRDKVSRHSILGWVEPRSRRPEIASLGWV